MRPNRQPGAIPNTQQTVPGMWPTPLARRRPIRQRISGSRPTIPSPANPNVRAAIRPLPSTSARTDSVPRKCLSASSSIPTHLASPRPPPRRHRHAALCPRCPPPRQRRSCHPDRRATSSAPTQMQPALKPRHLRCAIPPWRGCPWRQPAESLERFQKSMAQWGVA